MTQSAHRPVTPSATRSALIALVTGTTLALAPWVNAQAQEAPSLVATIPPLAGIAADIMAGISEPILLIDNGGSPHAFSLRPSDASALAQADYVLWVGEDLELFLADKLDNLAPTATRLTAMDLPGVTTKDFREVHDHGDHGRADHGHEDHGHEDDGHDKHGHDDHGHQEHDHEAHGHKDHGHRDNGHGDNGHGDHGHDDHSHDHAAHDHDDHEDNHGDHGHDHSGADPHIWMQPANAIAIARALAGVLMEDLPAEQAARIRSNLANFEADIRALSTVITEQLAPFTATPYVTFHDAYQYFETTFGLNYHGSVTVSPEVQPGAASLRALREEIREHNIACVFSEPQFEPRAIRVIAENLPVRTGMLDPVGDNTIGRVGGYQAFLTNLADGYAECLGPKS
ncbi:MAG: zinc ABC transporter substrate-binding protein [Pseudomonadota bacterium]